MFPLQSSLISPLLCERCFIHCWSATFLFVTQVGWGGCVRDMQGYSLSCGCIALETVSICHRSLRHRWILPHPLQQYSCTCPAIQWSIWVNVQACRPHTLLALRLGKWFDLARADIAQCSLSGYYATFCALFLLNEVLPLWSFVEQITSYFKRTDWLKTRSFADSSGEVAACCV